MGLDIRIPLSLSFLALGIILAVYGAITRGSAIYVRSLGVNVNLMWGVVMILFGLIMILTTKKRRS